MKSRMVAQILVVALVAAGSSVAKDTPDEQRAKIQKMSTDTLAKLYKLHPAARQDIGTSAGYAVFNNLGTNVLVLSTANGKGVAVRSSNKQETFMKMISAGVGLGIGVKKYSAIFVFENDEAFSKFIDSGWDASGQADAAAKTSSSGGAYSGAASVSPGV